MLDIKNAEPGENSETQQCQQLISPLHFPLPQIQEKEPLVDLAIRRENSLTCLVR
jgi:hypothetical protein